MKPSDSAITTNIMQATPELSQVIGSLIESAAVPPQPTLSDIRAVVIDGGIFVSGEGELLYSQDRTSLVIELDELIDCHGTGAAARPLLISGPRTM